VEQLYLKQQVMYSTYLLFSNGLPVCVKNIRAGLFLAVANHGFRRYN
jgi:hypothetical protein